MPAFQIRLSVNTFVIIVLIGVGLVALHYRASERDRRTIEFGTALVGGATTIYALLLNVQARRSAAAMKFIERFNDPKMFDTRKVISDLVRGMHNLDLPESRQDNLRILSYFEEVALAVFRKEADEEVLKGFFYTTVLETFRCCEGWVKKTEAGKKSTHRLYSVRKSIQAVGDEVNLQTSITLALCPFVESFLPFSSSSQANH